MVVGQFAKNKFHPFRVADVGTLIVFGTVIQILVESVHSVEKGRTTAFTINHFRGCATIIHQGSHRIALVF